ncbi:hypothetical protein XENOCAPTIV_025125 [Xenoophorus captivus]|uniref:Uncharacterized protein n=1 Tax=Xenoophorus captivus TaxID=1517983 RepID=A0ABV0QED7_9TELE
MSDTDTVMCVGGQRGSRAAPRQRRQAAAAEDYTDVEAEFNPENPYQVSHTFPLPPQCLHPAGAFRAVRSDTTGHLRRPVLTAAGAAAEAGVIAEGPGTSQHI